MATTLNAGTTAATSLNITTDTTGAMAIQTSGTTAIAISSAQAVTLTNPLPAGSGGTGVSSLGTGVATALGQNVTGSGSIVLGTSPTLTGTPVAPTATVGTNTTQIATTAFVIANAPVTIPAGTVMLFYQAAAPTGWTQVTTQNNKALRVVSGTGGGTGGTTAFSTVFTDQTPTITTSGLSVGATTLTTAQMPAHTHSYAAVSGTNNVPDGFDKSPYTSTTSSTTGSQGGGGSHTHTISGSATSSAITLAVQYIDIILASKN
jgi:hypothetical protein